MALMSPGRNARKRARAPTSAEMNPTKRLKQQRSIQCELSDELISTHTARRMNGDELRQIYGQISELQEQLRTVAVFDGANPSAAASLCRLFSRLIALGNLDNVTVASENEKLASRWLNERYEEYTTWLLDRLRSPGYTGDDLSLDLVMQLVKEECSSCLPQGQSRRTRGLFKNFLKLVLSVGVEDRVMEHFIKAYFLPFDDLKFFTLKVLK